MPSKMVRPSSRLLCMSGLVQFYHNVIGIFMQLRITGVALKKVAYSLLKGKDIKLLDVVIEVNKQPVISLPAPFGDVVKRMGSSSLVVDHSVSMDLPPDILDQCEYIVSIILPQR